MLGAEMGVVEEEWHPLMSPLALCGLVVPERYSGFAVDVLARLVNGDTSFREKKN